MPVPVQRHFVTIEGRWGARQVHYRRCGSGPLLLFLHQSPQSSRELIALMAQWGEEFTIVAPDSPGYGLSDPLGITKATLDDFAAASMEFMDAIQAQQFGIYGFHTGGMIGIAIADGYPDRVTALACNGVVVPTDAELSEILQTYLPPFEPQWDGSHLAWLWGRTREQTIFFPWHNRTLAGRMDFPMPSPEHQQNSVLEFLRAGEHYRVAYRAAFEYPAAAVIPRLQRPTVVTAADWDPLQPHLSRIKPDANAAARVVAVAAPTDALQCSLELLRSHPGDHAGEVPETRPLATQLWRQIVRTTHGELLVRVGGHRENTDTQTKACVILHAAGGSGATVATLAARLATTRPVVIIDLPGHGESDAKLAADDSLGCCADAVRQCLAALGLNSVSIVAQGAGAAIAIELATREPALVTRGVLLDLPLLDSQQKSAWLEQGRPALAPEWSGGHLLRAWHMSRDSRLYFPWFDCTREGIIWREPELAEQSIQLETTELLKSEGNWQTLLGAQLEYPASDRLAQLQLPVACAAAAASGWLEAARGLAESAGVPFVELAKTVAGQASAIAGLLDSPDTQ